MNQHSERRFPPSHIVRNRLGHRICTDSPDLLAIIKQEGRA